jgi:predicted nucleotidyltransferase component of viral defense system
LARLPAAGRACGSLRRNGVAQARPEAIIEKDFWACWVLKQLFSIEALSGRLLFKGGTSLSKIFHAINRLSEDIDLAVDYAAATRARAIRGRKRFEKQTDRHPRRDDGRM